MTPEEFLKNFGVLVEVPGGLGNLREMILELAFQGRLVAPVASDESAKELIQQIVQKRGKTTGEELGQTAINSNGTPQSPAHWCWTKLGQIAEVSGGITKGRNLAGRQVTAYPYLRVANVQRNLLNLSVMKEIEIPVQELDKYRLLKGDILFTEGGDWDKLGRSVVWEDQLPICLHQNHVFKARLLSPKLNPRWFSLFGNSPSGQQYFASASKQTTNLASINITQLRNLPVPVPPAPEQTRILAKVDQLMALCDELEARQTKKRETGTKLTQSALDALTSAEGPEEFAKAWQRVADNFQVLLNTPESIGKVRKTILELAARGQLAPQDSHDEPASALLDRVATAKIERVPRRQRASIRYEEELHVEPPFEIPQTWQWVRLDQLAYRVEYGTSSKPLDDSRGIPLLRMNNLQGGQIVFNPLRYISRETEDIDALMLEPGDILFNRTNSYELVGKTAVFLGQPHTYTFASYLIRASVLTGLDSARFLNLYFCTPAFRATQLEPGIVQQNGQANFNGSKLRSVWVPVPPLAEQKRIVAKVDQFMALCDTLESKLRDAEQGAQRLAEAMVAEMVA
ncbi:MAG: restriction endonuclease subunit S [Myxococcaceae bacterium]|nr:restriction endonuclease subunit S [Myxococcaceae bacterium]